MGTSECWNCHATVDDKETYCPDCDTNLDEDGAPLIKSDKPSAAALLLKKIFLAVSAAAAAGGIYYLVATERLLPILRTVKREAELLKPVDMQQKTKTSKGEKKQPVKGTVWRIYGRIYDLITLEPIIGANLSFRGKSSGKNFKARTDEQGFYTSKVAKIEEKGYAISVSHPKYGTHFSEDLAPSYATKSLERRKEAREVLRSLTQLHVPILPPREDDDYELDIVMSLP